MIHRVFDPVQLDIEIKDRFGNPVRPREWFLVPLFVVNEAVERIKDGSITQYVYDPTAARLVKRALRALARATRAARRARRHGDVPPDCAAALVDTFTRLRAAARTLLPGG